MKNFKYFNIRKDKMEKKLKAKKFLYWIPRVVAILFAIFISLFALDVFGEGCTFWETILALLIHLVPTYLVIIALLIAWKWEAVGGLIFIALGLFYIFRFGGHFPFTAYLIISGPLFLIGVLFLLNKFIK